VGVLDASIRFNQLEGGLLNLWRLAHFLSFYRIASSMAKFGVCSGIAGMGEYLFFVCSSCWHSNEQRVCVWHSGRVLVLSWMANSFCRFSDAGSVSCCVLICWAFGEDVRSVLF
jgi:hypothetical protein